MKLVHQIKLSVFAKETEDETKIASKLKELIPFKDLEKEKIMVNVINASTFGDKVIKINEIILDKQKHVKGFLEYIIQKLDQEQRDLLNKQIESRLDDDNNFFFRLDKDKLMNDEYLLTDSGNCFHIKITIAAFPKTRENAINAIQQII